MKALLLTAAAAALIVSSSGCCMPAGSSISAALIQGHAAPGAWVDNSVKPLKRGVAESKGILLYATGDSSISAAMKDGGIRKVHHIDYEVENILCIVCKQRTIVWGE